MNQDIVIDILGVKVMERNNQFCNFAGVNYVIAFVFAILQKQ